jgi:hypothetical protein
VKNDFTGAVVAIAIGNGLGFLLSIAGQKMINKHQIAVCPSKPNHSLVMVRSVVGDSYYCIADKYLDKH